MVRQGSNWEISVYLSHGDFIFNFCVCFFDWKKNSKGNRFQAEPKEALAIIIFWQWYLINFIIMDFLQSIKGYTIIH